MSDPVCLFRKYFTDTLYDNQIKMILLIPAVTCGSLTSVSIPKSMTFARDDDPELFDPQFSTNPHEGDIYSREQNKIIKHLTM